jgi:hypothetical protein
MNEMLSNQVPNQQEQYSKLGMLSTQLQQFHQIKPASPGRTRGNDFEAQSYSSRNMLLYFWRQHRPM